MPTITVPNPYGFDSLIQRLITRWYDRACAVWGVSDATYNNFARVYRNAIEGGKGYLPEFYNPNKRAYVAGSNNANAGGMFFEDKLAAMSFIYVSDPVKRQTNADDMANVQWLFFVDLSKITPGGITAGRAAGQRLDDVCINDVQNFLQSNGCMFSVTNVYRNVDKVLESFTGEAKRNTLQRDMHPRLCFRIDMKIAYNYLLDAPDSAIPNIPTMEWKTIVLFIKTTPNPAMKIPVGYGLFIQQEYAPSNTLIPKILGASNGYLAGREVQYPFTYNNNADTLPDYDMTTGVWDRTANASDDMFGFNDGDFVAITFLDTI
jgi:hypothetical protein